MRFITSGFIRGVGVGLIIAGLLVSFGRTDSGDSKAVSQNQSEAVSQNPTQAGSKQVTQSKSEQDSQPVAQAQQPKAEPTAQAVTQANQVVKTAEPQTASKAQPSVETPAAKTSAAKTKSSQDVVSLRIPGGSGSEEIAALLYDQGLIDSKQDFAAMSDKMKADTKFKAGKFSIPTGASDREIIEILIGK